MEERLLARYHENRRDLPWRRTHDTYAILVSLVARGVALECALLEGH